jgi:hypothetical protein
MEKAFIDFITRSPIGLFLVIVIGGGLVMIALYTNFKKVKDGYDSRVIKKIMDDNDFKNLNNNMKDVIDKVNNLQEGLDNIAKKHEDSLFELNSKIQELWSNTIEFQEENKKSTTKIEKEIEKNILAIDVLTGQLAEMDNKTNLLVKSDMENIKLYIVDKYYEIKEAGKIDINLLSTIESRYKTYRAETIKEDDQSIYLEKIMTEIRNMPT